MRISERLARIAVFLLLPLLYFAASYFFVTASVALGETDRAIVWAEGNPSQLRAMSRRVLASSQFQDGRVSAASLRSPTPEACGAWAQEFSIGSLKAEEAQAARALLESLAREAGANICLTDVFIINELPGLSPHRGAGYWSATLLQTMLLPLGIVLAVFLAFSAQLQLSISPGGDMPPARTLKLGMLGALVSLAALLAIQGAGGLLGIEIPGLPGFSIESLGWALTFALVLVVPAMEELVFRGWMLPLAERAIGPLPAAVITTVAFAASRLPATTTDALLQLMLGAILAAIYLRSRSLPACFLANATFSAMAFVPIGA